GAAVGEQGEALVPGSPASLLEVEADVVAARAVAARAGLLVEAERAVIVLGHAPARGVEEGEMRAARGNAAVAAPAGEIEEAGVVGGGALAADIAGAQAGGPRG